MVELKSGALSVSPFSVALLVGVFVCAALSYPICLSSTPLVHLLTSSFSLSLFSYLNLYPRVFSDRQLWDLRRMGDAACMRAHVQSNADAMASFDYRYGHYFGGAARGGMLRRVSFSPFHAA